MEPNSPFEQPTGRDTRRLRLRARTRAFRPLPIRSIIPNSITIMALCAGLTGIRFGLEGKYEMAVLAILAASLFDALDGRVARLLKGTTRFGAELDSLSDFVSFGVAPILVLYMWSLHHLGGVGWIVALGFSVCCALRLARFNVALEDPDRPAWTANYFVGVPAPAGAALAMLPLYLTFLGVPGISDAALLVGAHCGFVAFLMVSQIPTFSGKRLGLRIEREMVLSILLLVGLFAAVLLNYPWASASLLCLAYLASIPVAVLRYRQHKARTDEAARDTDVLPL